MLVSLNKTRTIKAKIIKASHSFHQVSFAMVFVLQKIIFIFVVEKKYEISHNKGWVYFLAKDSVTTDLSRGFLKSYQAHSSRN